MVFLPSITTQVEKKRRNKNDAQEQAWMRMRRYRPASLVKVSVVFRWRGLSLLESDLLIHFGLSFSIKEAACNMRGGKQEIDKGEKVMTRNNNQMYCCLYS
jgi:hypothetical protein